MSKLDLITVGETMVVFNPTQGASLLDSQMFLKQMGGSESNVAIGLARLGHKVGWFSRLSQDSLGCFIRNSIRANGVDISRVQFDQDHQTGLLIKEYLINDYVNVHYYRKNSAASVMDENILDREYFKNSKYLFITGITPLLSDSCKNMIFKAIHLAKEENVKIIFDPNIRLKLSNDHESYKNVINEIICHVDYFLPGVSEANFLCGKTEPEKIAKHYLKGSPNLAIIIKLGENGCFYADNNLMMYQKGYKIENMKDPVGAGDAFSAGFISGLLEGKGVEECLDKANLMGAIVMQTVGDVEGFPQIQQIEDFKQILSSQTNGKVKR